MNSRKFYIVRLRKDDSILAVGRGEECAKAMGMTINTFRTTVCRCLQGKTKKYDIYVEKEDGVEEE